MQTYPKHNMVMDRGGLAKVCPYDPKVGMTSECPHSHEKRDFSKKIKDDITDCVGNTPMIRVNNITKQEGIACDLLVKAEFLNPTGSVKDRIARRMIQDAVENRNLKKGDIIIEATSGNTGIALSAVSAAKGYRMVITLPEKMSTEKVDVLKALGAEIVRTPDKAPFDSVDSLIGVACRLEQELENSHVLDQYKNPSNPMAHYEETAEEIWSQTDGKIDYLFLGAGTGGTMCGISRKLKEKNPNIKIIGTDPIGSILAQPAKLNEQKPEGGLFYVEGIGYDFVPRVMDRELVDEWVKVGDKDAFNAARMMIQKEGFLCGGSSGTAMAGALQYIKQNNVPADKTAVVLCPDNIRNYITKFINNDWMTEHGFMEEQECLDASVPKLIPHKAWGTDLTVADLGLKESEAIPEMTTTREAIRLMRSKGVNELIVKNHSDEFLGIVTSTGLMQALANQKVKIEEPVLFSLLKNKSYRHMTSSLPVSELSRVLGRHSFVVVDKKYLVTSQDLLLAMDQRMSE